MTDRIDVPATPDPTPRPGVSPRAAALAEVMLAFAGVHVSYRAFKRFTLPGRWESAAGLNYSAGAAMILFTVGVLLLLGRDFRDYGLTLKGWRSRTCLGVVFGASSAALTILVVALMPPKVRAAFLRTGNPAASLAQAARELVMTLALFAVLGKRVLDRCPAAFSLSLIAGLLAIPPLAAWSLHRPSLPVLAMEGWLFLGAGFGEEVFFRGYVQSRIDLAFGRPHRVLGMDFGAGLIVSSLLFGLIHALNSVDYFAGRYHFAWWSGLSAIFAGLFFGCLREKTGSILAGGVAHGLDDAMEYGLKFLANS